LNVIERYLKYLSNEQVSSAAGMGFAIDSIPHERPFKMPKDDVDESLDGDGIGIEDNEE